MKNFNLRRIAPATNSGLTTEANTGFTGTFQGTKFMTPPVDGSAPSLCSNALNWSPRIQIRFGLPISFATAKCSWGGPEAARNRRPQTLNREWARINEKTTADGRRFTQMSLMQTRLAKLG